MTEKIKREIIYHDLWKLDEIQILLFMKSHGNTATLSHLHIIYAIFLPHQQSRVVVATETTWQSLIFSIQFLKERVCQLLI